MKKIVFLLTFLISIFSFGQITPSDVTQPVTNINMELGGGKFITWTTSNYGSGFGHRIVNEDSEGQTLLKFQGRHNTTLWSTIMALNSTGNIGMGMIPTTNSAKLTINGRLEVINTESTDPTIRLTSSVDPTYYSEIKQDAGAFKISRNLTGGTDITIQSDGDLIIGQQGNVGIGTTTPSQKLDVNGNIVIQGESGGNNGALGTLKFYNRYTSSQSVLAQIQARRGFSSHQKGDLAFYVKNGTDLIESFRVISNGNVGIGTTTPDAKLAVNGTVHSKEVKVDLTNWPDYVFTNNYTLPSLEEVEAHIKEKGHLENIPSAQEVEKNGILLGEMNIKLLQKIEELTLYTIQQQKELEQQKEKNTTLESRLQKLEQLVNSIMN